MAIEISSNNARIARNSVFLSIRMVIVLIINLYTTRVLLKTIGIVDYGVYNVVCGFVSMFTFLNASMSNAIQRFYNYELGKNGISGAKKVYNASLLIQFILALIILLLIETVGLWYLNNIMVIPEDRIFAAKMIFQISAVSFVLTILQAPYSAAVMAHEKMDFFAIMSIFDAVIKLLIILLLPILNGDRLIQYAMLLLLISVVNIICYFFYCRNKFSEIRVDIILNKGKLKEMLAFSGWNIFGTFSSMMKDQGINMVINLFFGPAVNAARGIAMQVNGALQGFVQNLTVPVRPQVIQSYAQGDIARTLSLTYSISKLSTILLYILSIPICYEINYLLSIWLGKEKPEYTGIFVIIIILTSLLNNLNAPISGVVHATGKMRNYQVFTSLTALMAIPLTYILLSFGFKPEWALWPVLFTMFFVQVVSLFILKTLISFSIIDYYKKVICPLLYIGILSIGIAYVPFVIMSEGILRLLIICLISLTFTPVIAYWVGLNPSEKILIKNLVYRIKKKL